MNRIALASLSALLAACSAVGPDYRGPSSGLEPATEWNGRLEGVISDEELDPTFLAQWWTALDDPVMTSLIERAALANLDLRTAETQLRQARAQRKIAESQGLPTVGVGGQAQRNTAGGATTELYSASVDAAWEIDLFGRIERGVEAADADLDAAEEARRDVLVSVLSEVALNYVDLRVLQSQAELARENLAYQEETFAIVEAQVAAGAGDQLDLDRAVANIESTRSQLPTLEQQVSQSLNRLAVLLGEAPGSLDAELGQSASIPVPPIEVAVGVPAEVLRRRPDVRQAERQLAAETARVGVAIADLYPSLSLGGTIGLQSDSTSSLFETASRVFSLGPRVQWTLFDGGATRQRIEAQTAAQEGALVNYERSILLALEEVENAIRAFTEEQLRYRSLLAASEAASSAAELARLRFEAGETDFLVVLDAQRTRLSSQETLILSEGTITSNLIRLYKGLGGGWDSTETAP